MSFSGVDETITCVNCKNPFVFTIGEQVHFTRLGHDRAPKRCLPCRRERRAQGGQSGGYNANGGYSTNTQPAAVTEAAAPKSFDDEFDGRKKRKGRRHRDESDEFDY